MGCYVSPHQSLTIRKNREKDLLQTTDFFQDSTIFLLCKIFENFFRTENYNNNTLAKHLLFC